MPSDLTPHEISLAVWDLPSPLVISQWSKMKVGATCSGACPLTDQEIEIRDQNKVTVGKARLGLAPWPGTGALYWTEVDFLAPATEGIYSWSVHLTASKLELPHAKASSHFSFVAVPPPEHCLTVKVVEKSTEVPVGEVEVRLGVHRGRTDESGLARVELPKGSYDLVVWKLGYEAFAKAVEVTADVVVQVEMDLAPEPEQPYWAG